MYFVEDRSLQMNFNKENNRKNNKRTNMFVEPSFPKPGMTLKKTDIAGFSSHNIVCFRQIPIENLPEKYPRNFLRIFSNLQSDFISAIQDFPEYKQQLLLLHELQSNKQNLEYRMLELFLTRNKKCSGKDYVEIKFEFHKKKTKSIEAFFDNLGLLSL